MFYCSFWLFCTIIRLSFSVFFSFDFSSLYELAMRHHTHPKIMKDNGATINSAWNNSEESHDTIPYLATNLRHLRNIVFQVNY